MKSHSISAVLDEISFDAGKFACFVALPCATFQRLNWPFLRKRPRTRNLVAIKTRQPLRHSRLHCDPDKYNLHYGRMRRLYSDAIPIGYILDLPQLRMQINQEYIVLAPHSVDLTALGNSSEVLINTPDMIIYLVDKSIQVAATFNNLLLPAMF